MSESADTERMPALALLAEANGATKIMPALIALIASFWLKHAEGEIGRDAEVS